MECPKCKAVIEPITERSGKNVLVKVGKCRKCNHYVVEKWQKVKCLLGDGDIENPHTLLTMEGLQDVTDSIKI